MPIGSDPNAATPFSLQIDRDKPEETRPAFICRFMSFKESQEMRRLRDEASLSPQTTEGNRAAMSLVLESIHIGVTGWKNFNDASRQPILFTDENLTAQLSELELWELAGSVPGAVDLAEIDRKKLVSRSLAAADASAPIALAANVTTNPVQTRP